MGALMSVTYDVVAGDFVRAGEAASKIKRLLQQLGLDPGIIRRAAIAAYEAEMNIVIHSYGGRVAVNITSDTIEMLCEDCGPGIVDIEKALQEGYSTASEDVREMGFGAGMGLPNIRRSADEFLIESEAGQGTRLQVKILHKAGE
ncbi:MAG: anti-sigma regulatory factor [Firmicutes bacterium]|nr:anti-sigma regulatory factor [Bacillota bacterium]